QSAAARNKAAAEAEWQMSGTRLDETKGRIEQRRDELENKHISWGSVFVFTGLAVATGILMLETGGSTMGLLAYLPDVVALSGFEFSSVPPADMNAVLSKVTGLKEWEEAKKNVPGSVMPVALSFAKMFKDVNEAQGDTEIIKLLREVVELTHARLLADLRNEQADFELQAVTLKLAQATRDLDMARSQLTGLTVDVAYLEQVALTLIRSAQRYMDILSKYAFFAARSLDIYTLADLSNEIRYDSGHIHPDLEQDYQDGMLPLSQLVGLYQLSWSSFVSIVNYRNIYDSYFGNGNKVSDKVFQSFTDLATLDQFRESRSLEVPVELQALPANRFEAKVNYVQLSLTGATANAPAISCLVEHPGRFTTKKRDGSTVGLLLRPKFAVIQTAKTGITHTGIKLGTSPRELSFWGRGVASMWNISIEPDEMILRQIDLSALSAIE